MRNSNLHARKSILLLFRTVLYMCALYFLLMGAMLIFFPHLKGELSRET